MYPVRNSVKALIIKDGRLLCIRKVDKGGSYFLLPGGGQEKDETFTDALRRECKEEIGAAVNIGKLKYIREYIAKNHEFRDTDQNHQVEYMFECELIGEPNLNEATNLDDTQDGIEWISLHDLTNRVYPKILLERLRNEYMEIYWGDIN